MSRVHKDSPTAILPQYSLWEVPGTQDTVLDERTVIIRPISTFSSSTPTRFEIRPPIDEYVMLNESELFLLMKVTLKKGNATVLTKDDWKNITPVPNLLHSIFKFVSLSINGRQINLSPSIYSYRAYLETLLGFTDDAKKGALDCVGWSDPKSLLEAGINSAKQSESYIDLTGPLHLDLTFQEKIMLGGTPLTLELVPHDPSFYFKGKNGFTVDVEFQDIYFKCQRMLTSPDVVRAHNQTLASHMAVYSYTRTEVKHRTIPANVNDYILDNLYTGILPRRIFIAFVSNNAFNGIGDESPYDFKPYGINFLASYVNGKQVPLIPFQPDFDNSITVREFRGLYRALNQTGTDAHYTVTRDEWRKKPIYGINYAVDLSNGGSFSSHVNVRTEGQLSLHVKFKTKNADPIVCIVMSETDSCFEIDSVRNVYCES